MIIEKVQYHRYVMDEMIERFQARIFNRKASDPKNRPGRILEVLKLQLRQRIADIGGYFSLICTSGRVRGAGLRRRH
jgi:hypothetical protein